MKKILLLFTILFMSVITTACINNFAIQELNNKAVKYMDKGDTEAAICRLKSSLDLDDEIYQTHYNLAVAYNSTGKYNEAVNELNTVLKLKPDYYDAYYTMGIAKEALAYKIINPYDDEKTYTLEELSEFNKLALEAVDSFNKYVLNNKEAEDAETVNLKIQELNSKIQEYAQTLNPS